MAPLKQASITSFFGQKQFEANRPLANLPQNPCSSNVDGATRMGPGQGIARDPSSICSLDSFSSQPPGSTQDAEEAFPTTIATATMGHNSSTSPNAPGATRSIDPASSISLGFPDHMGASLVSPQEVRSSLPNGTTSSFCSLDKPIEDHSGWSSSPARPSTPTPIGSKGPGSGGARTPTRTLFDHGDAVATASKRTAGMAAFSPLKARPSAKMARTSPTPSLRTGNKVSPSTSTPRIPSSPVSPVICKPAFSRDAEIRGSDDDDDSMSDASLPDIDSFVPSKPKPADLPAPPPVARLTPKRRGRSKVSLRSPLPLHTKPRFDLRTLLDHQRKDDAMNAAFKKHEDAEAEAVEKRLATERNVVTNSPNTVRQQFINMAGVQDETAGKALRAMERTETANSELNFWYFFKAKHGLSRERPKPFPKTAAQGPWSMLAKEGTRRRHIESGFFQKLAGRSQMPDELYTWLSDALRLETSPVAQRAYADLLCSASTAQIKRLINPDLLRGVYQGMGAVDGVDDEILQPVEEREISDSRKDWTTVQIYLSWMGKSAPHMEPETIQYAITSLLRMGADPVLMSHPELLSCHQSALLELVEAVAPVSWDNFCETTASALYKAFSRDCLRVRPLLCVSAASSRLRELRRRLARAFFHGDITLAGHHPDQDSVMPEVLARLMDSDFKMKRKTDFVKLRAQVQLMDMTLDDGSYVHCEKDADSERVHNNNIDELAAHLRSIWSSINDAGALYLSRTQAKSAMDCAQKRMTYSQRTKPLPKKSLFDEPRKRGEMPSVKTKAFMNNFLGNLKKPRGDGEENKATVAAAFIADDSSDVEETFLTAVGE